jgi:hypothetical protein
MSVFDPFQTFSRTSASDRLQSFTWQAGSVHFYIVDAQTGFLQEEHCSAYALERSVAVGFNDRPTAGAGSRRRKKLVSVLPSTVDLFAIDTHAATVLGATYSDNRWRPLRTARQQQYEYWN